MTLQVIKYTSYEKDNLAAFVSFYIPEWGLYLNDCRLIRKKNGGFFIGFPSKKIEGEEKYSPYFMFDKEKNERFRKAAIEAIDKWVKENNTEQTQAQATLF